MNQDLFKILKNLKNIQPDPNYSKQSRFLILAQARNNVEKESALSREKMVGQKVWLANVLRVFYPAKLALVSGVIISILIVAGSTYYINNQLNQKDLVVKASEMNTSIQVKLNEIKYLLENKSQHLDLESILTIQALLEKAANELKEVLTLEGRDLDEALKKIKSSQEVLEQIDVFLKNK